MSLFKKTEIRFDQDFYDRIDSLLDTSEESDDSSWQARKALSKDNYSLYIGDTNKRIIALEEVKKKIEKTVKKKPQPEDDLYVYYFEVYQTLGTSYAYNHQLKEAFAIYQEIYEAFEPEYTNVFDNILALTYAFEGLEAVGKLIEEKDPHAQYLLSALFKAILAYKKGENHFFYLDKIQNSNPFFYYLLCEDIHPDETEFPILRSTNLTLLIPSSVNYAVTLYAFLADVFDGKNELENEIKKIIPRHPSYGLCSFFDEFERCLISNHYSSSEDEDGNFICFTRDELYQLLTGKDIHQLPDYVQKAKSLIGILPNLTEKELDGDLEDIVDFGILNPLENRGNIHFAFADCCDLLSIWLIQSKSSQMHSLNYKVQLSQEGIEYAYVVVTQFKPGFHKSNEYYMRKDTSFDALCRLFVNEFDVDYLSNPIFISKDKIYNQLYEPSMTLENILDKENPAVFVNNGNKENSLKIFYHPEKNVAYKSHQPIHFNNSYGAIEGFDKYYGTLKEGELAKAMPDDKKVEDFIKEVNDRLSTIR